MQRGEAAVEVGARCKFLPEIHSSTFLSGMRDFKWKAMNRASDSGLPGGVENQFHQEASFRLAIEPNNRYLAHSKKGIPLRITYLEWQAQDEKD